MKALAALRTKKVLVSAGPWHSGNVTNSEFPLAHVSKLKLAKAWQWSVHVVADDAQKYRLLVAFDAGKSQYWAWLGAIFGNDQAIIGRVEFHHSHDGWHCHWKTGQLVDVPRGAVKAGGSKERRHPCNGAPPQVSRTDAFKLAYKLFNVSTPPMEFGA